MNKVDDIEYINDTITGCIEHCDRALRKYNRTTMGKKIEFGFHYNNFIGGESSYDGQKYSVEINYGVLEKIRHIYSILLHENNEEFYKKISLEDKFNDKKANAYWFELVDVSLKFVIFHELGHIYNGHLKYLYEKNKNEKSSLCLITEENKEISPLFSQCLEMDADSFAATQLLSLITFNDYVTEKKDIIKAKAHAFYMFYITSGILFFELGINNNDKDTKSLNDLYYLPTKVRLDTIVRSGINAYFTLNPELIKKKDESSLIDIAILREYMWNTELFHLMLQSEINDPGSSMTEEYNFKPISEQHIDHANKILDYWKVNVKQKLNEHSVFILAN